MVAKNKAKKSSLNIPIEFDEVVKKITSSLAGKSTFGIYTKEDIAQEIYIFCLQSVKKYDGKRNLYNFLFTCCRRLLKNLYRNEFFRYECPCKLCSFKQEGETGHTDGKLCDVYKNWFRVNSMKSNLANPVKFTEKFDVIDNNKNAYEDVDNSDFLEKIENDLPIELRETYLKMKTGVHVSYKDKQLVLDYLKKYTI